MFKRCLEKPWKRRESKLLTQPKFTGTVEIMISDCDFYRFGWELSLTDMAYLHNAFEKAVKLFMRTCIAIDISMSGSQAQSIRRFQTQYEYPEEIWPFQSIKKDLDRNLPMDSIKFEKDVYVKFQEIVLAILYKSGTITKNNIGGVAKLWLLPSRSISFLQRNEQTGLFETPEQWNGEDSWELNPIYQSISYEIQLTFTGKSQNLAVFVEKPV